MTTSPTQPSAALDPMVAALESAIERRVDAEWNYCLSKNVTNAMGVVPDRIVNEVAGAEAGLENVIRQLIERLVKPQYSLDADYLKAEMAKVGITEDQAANAARIVLASLTPAPPIAVPADHVLVSREDAEVAVKALEHAEETKYLHTIGREPYANFMALEHIRAALAADQTDAG